MMSRCKDNRFRYAYKFRIYPNDEQKLLMEKSFGCYRLVYNELLADCIKQYEETGKSKVKSYKILSEKHPYLSEVDCFVMVNAKINLERAYKKFFLELEKGKLCYPRFKTKRDEKQSYTTNNVANKGRKNPSIIIYDEFIKLPKLGRVKCLFHREVIGDIKSVTVSRNRAYEYYVSILVARNKVDEPKQLAKTGKVVGIDLGKKVYAIMSDGCKLEAPPWLKYCDDKIDKSQKALSRKQKGSANWEKARKKLAKAYLYKTNKINYFLQNETTNLIRKYDVIVVENLSISRENGSMLRGDKRLKYKRKSNRETMSLSWYRFREILTYKAKWYDKTLIVAKNNYPSSQICHLCGYKNKALKDLKKREFICPQCNSLLQRDENASMNLLHLYTEHKIEYIELDACVNF